MKPNKPAPNTAPSRTRSSARTRPRPVRRASGHHSRPMTDSRQPSTESRRTRRNSLPWRRTPRSATDSPCSDRGDLTPAACPFRGACEWSQPGNTQPETRIMARRQPIKPLNKSTADIAADAAAEKARKAASRKALREAKKADQAAIAEKVAAAFKPTKPEPKGAPIRSVENEQAVRAEMAATGMSLEEACDSMGVDHETFLPVEEKKLGYTGPMLILREAAKHYVKGIHCGDDMASMLDGLKREQVVDLIGSFLVEAKITEVRNPYLHLNPGQQSMNLRNKLRAAIKNGMVEPSLFQARVEAARKQAA